MAFDVDDPGDDVLQFLRDRHLSTLTTMRRDGSPHVTPVGFGYDLADRIARVICGPASQKVLNARHGGRAALCQVDGGRWLTLEGAVQVVTDPASVARAVEAYTLRYQAPRERPERVALEITVDRIMGRV
ncbi:MAG: TIGR03618 family F420-dependent PPOX class oxidoreductase [Ilumatobacter sp.]|nr:TIGR03618 family F420-dependent PPOX class oxidoreductase [Ilumatobacter sp.]